MEIIMGKNIGFCFGVKRALEGTLNESKKNNKVVYCLGELVHNKDVINDIKNNGIIIINDIDEIKENNSKLIIRAHGVDKRKKIYAKAKQRNIDVIDFTCPLVNKIHNIVEKYKNQDYYIFLIGNKNHPEIIGTVSYCGDNYSIIENIEELEINIDKLLKTEFRNLLVVVQTTFSTNKFNDMEKKINEKLNDKLNIAIKNTICNSTEQRQIETEDLSKKVDLMIIIGGKNSSNTKKLHEIAKRYTNSLLVESDKDVDLKLLDGCNKIGIMSGSSTPQSIIDLLVKKLKNYYL